MRQRSIDRILLMIKREFLETARTKWFLIGLVVFPLFLLGMTLVPALLIRSGGDATRCAVMDETGVLLEPLKRAAQEDPRFAGYEFVGVAPEPGGVERLKGAVGRDEYDAVLHLPAGVLESSPAAFYARGLGIASERLDNLLTAVVTRHRLEAAGVDQHRIDSITRWVPVESFQVSEGGAAEKQDWGRIYLVTIGFVMLIYITVAIHGVTIMNSTVQEKSSRVMEVLLSSTSPFELLAGKLLGKGAAALTQLGTWALAGLAVVLAGGSTGMTGSGSVIGAIPPSAFGWFIVFFLLAFFTMASVFAAAGSTCNTPEEATQLQFPAILPLVTALVLSFLVISHPDGTAGALLSFVPFLSPTLMFVRILVRTPPLWQILLACAINLMTILATVWLASRIYRVGVLMYGKRPTLPEIVRWVRAG